MNSNNSRLRRLHHRPRRFFWIVFPLAGVSLIAVVSILSYVSISSGVWEGHNPVATALKYGQLQQRFAAADDTRPVLDPLTLYPKEDPIPNPPLADGYDTFSACMLIMDDNHR